MSLACGCATLADPQRKSIRRPPSRTHFEISSRIGMKKIPLHFQTHLGLEPIFVGPQALCERGQQGGHLAAPCWHPSSLVRRAHA
jgi:hypothetical protein